MGRDAHSHHVERGTQIHLLLSLAPGFTYGMLVGWLWAVSTSRNHSVLLLVGHCASSHVVHVCVVIGTSTGMANPAKARVLLALILPAFLPLLAVAQFGKKACSFSSLSISVSVSLSTLSLSLPPLPFLGVVLSFFLFNA